MLTLAIDASRANREKKTGVENYALEIIESLKKQIPKNIRVVLYSQDKLIGSLADLPENWQSKVLYWPPKILWTHLRLSLEILFFRPDILFIPAHTTPLIHPQKTIMTVHDVAAIKFKKSFNFFERWYSIWSVRQALKKNWKIIVPSEFTKKELEKLASNISEKNKIEVVYHGFNNQSYQNCFNEEEIKKFNLNSQYLISIGRIEEKKNTKRIIEAFEIIKEDSKFKDLKLVLVGKPGYGFEAINKKQQESHYKNDIIFTGYLKNEESFEIFKHAQVFVFPSLYEGFGLPLLEAFFYEVPAVISKDNSLEEIAEDGALLVDCLDSRDIAEKIKMILENPDLKINLVNKGKIRLKNFSWEKSGLITAKILLS